MTAWLPHHTSPDLQQALGRSNSHSQVGVAGRSATPGRFRQAWRQHTYDAGVASRDSAFLWETEVLRSSRRPNPAPSRAGAPPTTDPGGWLTVREASEATGVPTSTIRKWARHENIPSYLEETENGYLRIVSIEGIAEWAGEIGRDVSARSETGATAPRDEHIDLTEPEPEGEGADPKIPEGTMLVPLDAWNKMLNQLGNLHEAGQQLAEARERAAKAETEARFLKDRLRELREEMEPVADTPTRDETVAAADRPARSRTRSLVRTIYSDWRRRRRRL